MCRVSGVVVMDLRGEDVVVVVFWSVECGFRVYVWVYFQAYSEDVQVGDIEDLVFRHQWFCVCSWWESGDKPDDFLLHFDEWLDVGCLGVGGSPNGDVGDWVDVGVVELYHGLDGD